VSTDVTHLLKEIQGGNRAAQEELIPLVYGELRRLAASYMQRERSGHTLQATALVHEAFLRLANMNDVDWQGKSHFFAVAAQSMRRILISHAREKNAQKRGGGVALTLHEDIAAGDRAFDVIELDLALEKLAQLDERQAKVVELRFFGGLEVDEVSQVLGASPATIKRDWVAAKAWLYRELGPKS
jgi:RNA polymerase sigma factor (TIGR02999 family)